MARVLVTGANGFIGQNLRIGLAERGHEVLPFTRAHTPGDLARLVPRAEAVVHLAGANRPPSEEGFERDNRGLTEQLAGLLADAPPMPVIFASSSQAERDNPYGRSKRAAEAALEPLGARHAVSILRLPNVFGKWARPFYNSAVATFCHQAARGLALSVNDPAAPLTLVYVDDVVSAICGLIDDPAPGLSRPEVRPGYETTVGDVADMLARLAADRPALRVGRTGGGLERALYATLLSHLEPAAFAYDVPAYGDARGRFVEAVKTPDAGQFSYFTQVPGLIRGGHYHHSKSEKFLVVRGRARFRFRHLMTGERVDVVCGAELPRIVDTIPGWTHDVENLGDEELIVLVWANEVFDRDRPDTVVAAVEDAAA